MNLAAQSLDLRKISPCRVELENLLLTRQSAIAVSAEGRSEELRVTAEDVAVAHEIQVICEIAAQDVGLSVDAGWMSGFVPDGLASFQLSELPPPLGMALAELGLSPLLISIGELFASSASLKRVTEEAQAAETVLALRSVEDLTAAPKAQVFLDGGAAQRLVTTLRKRPPCADPSTVSAVSLTLFACVGSQRLTQIELNSLVSGAIVLFETPPAFPTVTLLLGQAMRPYGLGILSGRDLTLEETLGPAIPGSEDNAETLDGAMPTEGLPKMTDEENAATGETISIDELEVCLDFVAGQKTLPLTEIKSLTSGATITLDRPASQAVGIYASGRRLGVGELVDIGGQLGVRILKINAVSHG